MAPLVLQEPQALQVPPDQPAPPVLPALQEPQDQQATGPTGRSVRVGTTTTLDPGQNAMVTDTGDDTTEN